MKIKFHRIFLVTTLILSVVTGKAQTVEHRNSISLGWGVSIPAGDKNFTNKSSWVSPSLDWEYRIIPQLSVGVAVGYTYSNEKGITNDRYDDDILSGYTDRKLSILPLQVKVNYFLLGAKKSVLQPYLSIAGGVQYARFGIKGDAISSSGTENWAGVVTPGLGLRFYLPSYRIFFDLNGSWQYGGNKWTLLDSKSQNNVKIGLSAGFRF